MVTEFIKKLRAFMATNVDHTIKSTHAPYAELMAAHNSANPVPDQHEFQLTNFTKLSPS
jgi:hypothetical protein